MKDVPFLEKSYCTFRRDGNTFCKQVLTQWAFTDQLFLLRGKRKTAAFFFLGNPIDFPFTHKFLHLLKDCQGDRFFFPPLRLLWGLLAAGKQLVLFPVCALIFFYSIYYNHVFVSHAADRDRTMLCIFLHNISRSMDDELESPRECLIWWDMDMCLFLCVREWVCESWTGL